jgi:hypothetical protein
VGQDGANVELICGLDQSRRDAAFQHDGQISTGRRRGRQAKCFSQRDWTVEFEKPEVICPTGKISSLPHRHCERSEAIHSFFARQDGLLPRSLSSGAHSRDPLARNDDPDISQCARRSVIPDGPKDQTSDANDPERTPATEALLVATE